MGDAKYDIRYSVAYLFGVTSALGLEPAIMIRPSGTSVATEWYMRGIRDVGSPSVEKREPAGALGS